jgi:putative FmdB family regulatory protein
MPLYEYECGSCGPFSAIRKMSESSLSMQCESCGSESARIISVPYFALLAKAKKAAYELNEKSAHEPKSFKRSSCGCSGSHTCQSTTSQQTPLNKENKSNSTPQANGFQMQTKRTARPWMLGH